MGEWVAEVRHAHHNVVIRTPPGCAHVVASALDRSGIDRRARHGGRRRHAAVRSPTRRRPARSSRRSCATSPASTGAVMSEGEPDESRPAAKTLWHGRFEGGPAAELMAFTESLSFDRATVARRHRRLARPTCAGSRTRGIITETERDSILAALDQVADRDGGGHVRVRARPTRTSTPRSSGASPSSPEPPARKLHTGRSRNDQSATDVRLWLQARAARRRRAHRRRCRRCCSTAPTRPATRTCPGYTHLQRAQPVLLAHHLLAHGWALGRDVDRIRDTLDAGRRVAARRRRARRLVVAARSRRSPRPSSASPHAFENSLDAVGSRDHVAEALFDARRWSAINLSRIGEEWVLWTTEEFGFATLDDGYSTGSSMLPQKKNPDIAELARGKAGRLIGDLTGLPGDDEGPAAQLQPRLPGGQGAAVRRGRSGPPRPRRDDRA